MSRRWRTASRRATWSRPDEPQEHHCGECGKTLFVHGGDRDTAFIACQISGTGTIMCPYWRKGLTDDWWDKARWFEDRRRAERAAKTNQSIPE